MAHGFLSYTDTRGEVDYLSKIGKLLKKRQKETGKKGPKGSGDVELKDTPEGVEPVKVVEEGQKSLAGSGPKGLLKGSALSSIVGKDPKGALPPGKAIQPEVLGGALSRISRKPGIDAGSDVYDTTAVRVDDPAGSLSGIGELIVRSNNNVIEAIMGVQRVTVRVVDSVENLGRMQAAIAERQMQQQMLLATRAEIAAEKRALAAGSDLSDGITADAAGQGPRKGGGFLQLPGLGGVPRLPMGRRGGPLARRAGSRGLTRAATRAGTKGAAKIGAKALGKGLLKKIPLIGLGAGALFAAERAMAGDFAGAGLELASGGASMIPGLGTAASVGIDAALAGRDMGLTPFAEGGIVSQPTVSLTGEAGNEGVFPLEGSRGKKTFLNFGRGVLDAQKESKKDYGNVLAEGFKRYFSGMDGWGDLINALLDMFKKSPIGKWLGLDDDGKDKRRSNGGGGGGPRGGAIDVSKLAGDTPEAKAWLAAINATEAGGKDRYNKLVGGEVVPELTQMTMQEVYDMAYGSSIGEGYLPERFGGRRVKYGADSHAAGAFQFHPATMMARVKQAGMDPNTTLFTPENQQKLALAHLINLGVDPNKAMDSASLAKAGSMAGWQGLSVENGHITEAGAMKLYADMLQRANAGDANGMGNLGTGSNDPNLDLDLEETPSWTEAIPFPSGLKPGHSGALKIADGIFARVKDDGDTGRWQIYKQNWGGPDKGELSTVGANNAKLEPLLKKRIEEYNKTTGLGPQANAGDLSPAKDDAAALSTKSTEIAMANLGGGGTVINNTTYVTGGQNGGGNSPGNVPMGISSRDTGTSAFHELGLRTIG
jgi:muramidase (phage lysozyme)